MLERSQIIAIIIIMIVTPWLMWMTIPFGRDGGSSPSPGGGGGGGGSPTPGGGGGGGGGTTPPKPGPTPNGAFPTSQEIMFKSKEECQTKGGVLNWVGDSVLLTCNNIVRFGQPESPIFNELDQVKAAIASGALKPATEKDRLVEYFKLVYPNSPATSWSSMSEADLVGRYQKLEIYYKMPPEIQPATPITPRRDVTNQFFRVPNGVTLDQDANVLGQVGPYLEVIRFGPMYSFFADPTLFVGTYYYPVRGSGLYLPLGKTLVAYNKVHAMKLLGAANDQIVLYGGRDFQSFLRRDSESAEFTADAFVSVCAVNKRATSNNPGCDKIFNYFANTIRYKAKALDRLVGEMAAGKSLRYDTRAVNGVTKKTLVYYGCGDTGDKFLAQLARNRGYNTLQFLREAQMELDGDAIVGYELLHLVENAYSQTALMRLDPMRMPLYMPEGTTPAIPPNYLLTKDVMSVDVKAVINSEFKPFNQKVFDIDLIVQERNSRAPAPPPNPNPAPPPNPNPAPAPNPAPVVVGASWGRRY